MRYSIIIPMYNVQEYIKRCLNSIFIQGFSDYELILVDDGSTDNTLEEARQYVKTNQKESITTIHVKNNSGASDTRNAGIRMAKGEFIIFMDADDTMTKDALTHMDKATREYESDLYVFSLKKEIDGFVSDSILSNVNSFFLKEENSVHCLERYLDMTNRIITWQPWSKVFRRSIIENNHVSFDTTLYCCNDFNFFMKYFLCIKSVCFMNIPTTIYTVDRLGAISNTKLEKRFLSSTKAYSDMFYRIRSTGTDSETLLDYMSYLFLCSFDIVSQLSREQLSLLDGVVDRNHEVYCYAHDKISKLRRLCFAVFGYRIGVGVFLNIRKLVRRFRKGNSEI